MSWARLDDRFHGNPKVLHVWHTEPAAIGLYVMGITHCAQHETDGLVHEWFVFSVVFQSRKRAKLVNALTAGRLWIEADGGWQIPDYLDYNPSNADLSAKRERERERLRKARAKNVDDMLPSTPDQPAAVLIDPVPARPLIRPTDAVAASGDTAQQWDVATIWTLYLTTRQRVLGARSTPRLTSSRRALIARRLKEWPADDIADAVQGWQHFPHNRGENERGTPFCDLELLLRDAAHIERFRDRHRELVQPAESMAELADRMTAAHQEAAAA